MKLKKKKLYGEAPKFSFLKSLNPKNYEENNLGAVASYVLAYPHQTTSLKTCQKYSFLQGVGNHSEEEYNHQRKCQFLLSIS